MGTTSITLSSIKYRLEMHSLGLDARLVLVIRFQVPQHVRHALDGLLCRGERGQGDIDPLIMHQPRAAPAQTVEESSRRLLLAHQQVRVGIVQVVVLPIGSGGWKEEWRGSRKKIIIQQEMAARQ